MLTSNINFRAAQAANQARTCNAPGCCYPRVYMEAFCRSHYRRAERFGAPLALPVPRRAWLPYRASLQALWSHPANARHDGLIHWEGWADELLQKAVRDPSRLSRINGAAPELARLVEAGLTGRQLLETAVAFGVYALHNGHLFPTLRAHDFATSRAILFPRAKSASGWSKEFRRGALGWLGSTCREELAPLVAMTSVALEQQAKRDARTPAEIDADRRRPFAV